MSGDGIFTASTLFLMFNTILLGGIGFLITHILHDIKTRLVRLENLFIKKEGCNDVF